MRFANNPEVSGSEAILQVALRRGQLHMPSTHRCPGISACHANVGIDEAHQQNPSVRDGEWKPSELAEI